MNKKNPRICVYSVIFNEYDTIKNFPKQTVDCDFILFTDSPEKFSENHGWQIRKLPIPSWKFNKKVLVSRYIKIMSQKIFTPDTNNRLIKLLNHIKKLEVYDYTIWIDASLQIQTETFVQEMISMEGPYQIVMFVHPERSCIFDEAFVLENDLRFLGNNLPFTEQVNFYSKKGYPHQNGLMATGVILRNTKNRIIRKIERQWWKELRKWTFRDQLSLPYILWKNQYDYDKIDLNLWDNHLIKFIPHKHNLWK